MGDLIGRLQAALGDAFRVERELGGGGMGRVFVAEELRLRRAVVIKVLPPDTGAGINAERFEREVLLAARLQHPHIVPVLSTGAAGDLLYYVMPLIEGESLRARLAREGPLPVRDALRILREVLDALSYAHAQQIVHRDIKPDNVLLSGRHALVTDFGVAKALSASTGESALTSVGIALGTPAYMAPEQATGDGHVDHRADLYALGAMAYEMLAGRTPFEGSGQMMLTAHVVREPEPVTNWRSELPPAFAAIVMRCLAKQAADRPQSADEIASVLEQVATPSGGGIEPSVARPGPARVHGAPELGSYLAIAALLLLIVGGLTVMAGLPTWVFVGAAVILALGVAAPLGIVPRRMARRVGLTAFVTLGLITLGWSVSRATGIGPAATLLSGAAIGMDAPLIVADFDNTTSDSTLGRTLARALRVDLGQSPVVRVLDESAMPDALFRMRRPEGRITRAVATEMGEREGAVIVAGDVAAVGEGFVLSAVVISPSGTELLSVREAAANSSELIPTIDRLSKRLRGRLGESLRSLRGADPLHRVTTASISALRLYNEAFEENLATDYERADLLVREAIREDSLFGAAWRLLGMVNANLSRPAGRDSALRRAMELRDRMIASERAFTEASFYSNVEGDVTRAIAAYERLLESDPTSQVGVGNLAALHAQRGDDVKAESLYRVAGERRPSATYAAGLLLAQLRQRRFTAAESALAIHRQLAPSGSVRLVTDAIYHRARGALDSAAGGLDSAARARPRAPVRTDASLAANAASLAAARGRPGEAIRFGAEAERRSFLAGDIPGAFSWSLHEAFVELVLRERPERAFATLGRVAATYDSVAATPAARLFLAEAQALAGDTAEARRQLRRVGLPVARSLVRGRAQAIEGEILVHSGRWIEAADAFLTAANEGECDLCWQYRAAYALEAAGLADSARAVYARALEHPRATRHVNYDAVYRAPALLRAAALHEDADPARAMAYYREFLEQWKDAEPEMRPRLDAARARLERLERVRR